MRRSAFSTCLGVALATGLLAATAPAGAQTLYRCGNTYSQTPCAADAASARMSSSAPPDAAPGAAGRELCASDGVARLGLPDPEAVRVRSVTRAGTEVIQYAGKPIAARHYVLVLNAKNAQGGYDGDRRYSCYLSEDERRVLQVGPR